MTLKVSSIHQKSLETSRIVFLPHTFRIQKKETTCWENNDTIVVISLGEKDKPLISYKAIIENAIKVMTARLDMKPGKTFAKGVMAYDAWEKAILNESNFPTNAIFPILSERLMCHGDAMDCLIDGRRYAVGLKEMKSKCVI